MSKEPIDARQVRYVFLDRDGVLNRKMPEGVYVSDWDQFAWLPGAAEAVGRLNKAGLTVLVVSNQRGIALGLATVQQVESIHQTMQAQLAALGAHLDAIYYCPHDVRQCHCRKPDVGMFEQAFQDFPQAGPHNSLIIGDSLSDIQAGDRLGMQTIFIEGEPDRRKAGANAAAALANAVSHSLLEATEVQLGIGGPTSLKSEASG